MRGAILRAGCVCLGFLVAHSATAEETIPRPVRLAPVENTATANQAVLISAIPIAVDDALKPVALPPIAPTSITAYADVLPAEVTSNSGDADPAKLPIAQASYYNDGPSETYFSLSELRKEMEKVAWKKGDFRIVPYGTLWGSAIYATDRTYPGAYTLFVQSPDIQGEDSFIIDTRRTRVGLDISGPDVPFFCCAKSGGKLEIDFHGAFVIENKPGVLLRHAYGEIKSDSFRLLAGQTWDVISPLNPGSLGYSVMWGQGNIGYRRAQIRWERYRDLPGGRKLTTQLSLNEDIVSDFATDPSSRGECANWPVIQGRIAITDEASPRFHGPMTFGVSGHIGEQGFDFLAVGPAPPSLPPQDDVRIKTWSINADLKMPITERFGVQGEFFSGQNMGTFLGGIIQGVCPCTREGIRSRGGWVSMWYDWSPCMRSYVGYGVDDPVDRDMLFGRSYNDVIFANITRNLTEKLVVGVEASYANTTFRETRPGEPALSPGESLQFELMGKYAF